MRDVPHSIEEELGLEVDDNPQTVPAASMQNAMLQIHHRMQTDLAYFMEKAPIYIKVKKGELIPFVMNKTQRYIHDRLETQLRETGMVRALILKGRQQGASTYVAARFYHKTSRQKAKSAYILSHDAGTTTQLFDIVKRYNDNVRPEIKPALGKSNWRQLVFSGLGSDYWVGTANSPESGRGGTRQLFHGSEVAFWENTDQIVSGIMQSISDEPGTEKILESTANGMGNMFYSMCMDALKGRGQYILIFTPWYWSDEYESKPEPDFKPSSEEAEYAAANFKEYAPAVQLRKLHWRRNKIIELSERKFKQEYPANVIEAFQTTGTSLFDNTAIMAARKTDLIDSSVDDGTPRILGIDAARKGDNTVITMRRGREVEKIWKYNNMDEMWLVGLVARLIDQYDIKKAFFDVAYAHGAIDRLRELGYGDVVMGVHFGMTASAESIYRNKRAEMYGEAKKWFDDVPVKIPDDEELHADLMSIPDFKVTSNSKFFMEDKEEIIKKLGRSPDYADSFVLTFAFPVRNNALQTNRQIGPVGRRNMNSANRDSNITSLRGRLRHGMELHGGLQTTEKNRGRR